MPYRFMFTLSSCMFLINFATASAAAMPSPIEIDATCAPARGVTRLAQAAADRCRPAEA